MVLAAARLFTPVLRRSLLPVTCSVRKVGGSTQLRAEQLGLRSDQALWLALQVTHWASIAGVLAVPGILKRGQYCGEKGKGKIQSPASYRTLTGQASGFVWLRFRSTPIPQICRGPHKSSWWLAGSSWALRSNAALVPASG